MRIGIDVDGVLGNVSAAVIAMLREQGFAISDDDWADWGMTKLRHQTSMTISDLLDVMDQVWNARKVELHEHDTVASLYRLIDAGHTITVITKRTPNSRAAVAEWLNNMEIPYEALVFAGQESKLEYPIDVLVDDSPFILEDAVDYPDRKLYLIDRPWNSQASILFNNVKRVRSIAEAVNDFLAPISYKE